MAPPPQPPQAATDEQVLKALEAVVDPEMERTLGELGMARGAVVEDGRATVQVALPNASYPAHEVLTDRVADALAEVPGIEHVHVDLRLMSDEMVEAAARVLRPEGEGTAFTELNPRTRVLGISSGKGGVGKSSATVGIGVALARLGHRVGILDGDVYGFSIPAMLGIDRPPLVVDRLIIPPLAHGVRAASIGFFVPDEQAVVWRGPMLHRALEQLLVDVHWAEPDFLLVDMPPGTGDIAISMAQHLPRAELLVVTTPQPAAERVAQRTAAFAAKVGLDVKGVVENMSWFSADDGTRYELFGAGGGEALAERLDVPLLGKVPLVPALREGGDVGVPIGVRDPDGEAGKAFLAIAERIAATAPKKVFRKELRVR